MTTPCIRLPALMKVVVWLMIVSLAILHQDNWLWDDSTLVLGFIPIGLAYHACLSIAAGVAWYLATIFCWPDYPDHPPADSGGTSPHR